MIMIITISLYNDNNDENNNDYDENNNKTIMMQLHIPSNNISNWLFAIRNWMWPLTTYPGGQQKAGVDGTMCTPHPVSTASCQERESSLMWCHAHVAAFWINGNLLFVQQFVQACYWKLCIAGGRLNKKDGLTRYGNSHVKDKTS